MLHHDAAQLRMILPLQRAALVHVRIGHHLGQLAHRRARHPAALQQLEQLLLGEPRRPAAHHAVDLVDMRDPVLERGEARIGGKVLAVHGRQQRAPMDVADADDGDVAVACRVDVVRRLGQAGMAVAGARRPLRAARAMQQAEAGGERRIHRVQHRHLDLAAGAGALAFEPGGDDGAVEMGAGEEVAQRRAGLDRRAVREPGDAHHPGHRLHGQVHAG